MKKDVVYTSLVKHIKREGTELKPMLKILKSGNELADEYGARLEVLKQYFGMIPGYNMPDHNNPQ